VCWDETLLSNARRSCASPNCSRLCRRECYFSTPNGNLLDANPALVGLLGYEKKAKLLSLDAGDLNSILVSRFWAVPPGTAAPCARGRLSSSARTVLPRSFSIPRVRCGTPPAT